MHLMATFINTVLIPLAASNTLVRREMERTTTQAISQMEDKINIIMQKTIDVAIVWVGKLLAGQKKTDYKPRDDVIGGTGTLLELNTSTCLTITNFLQKLQNLAVLALSPQSTSLIVFLTEIATNVRSQLLDHYKKFAVSAAGAIMVTKDIGKYNDVFRSWNLDDSFKPSLEVLTEIGNIFVISPEALRERLRGGARGGGLGGMGDVWEKGDLRPYVLRREDASSVGVQSVLGTL